MLSSFSTTDARSKWLLIAVGLASAMLGVFFYLTATFQSIQDAAIDKSFVLAGSHGAPSNIVIVAVDDATLQHLDTQLPIPRTYYAHLLDILHASRPGLVGLDLQFIGTSRDPSQDRRLLGAFRRDGPTLVTVSDTGKGVPAVVGKEAPSGVEVASGAVDADSDGVIRKMLGVQVRLQTFAVKASEMATGRQISSASFPDNHNWISFRGPPGTFNTYSMIDVLDGRVPSRTFTHKIVLVGVTAPIGKDVFVTSESSKPMSGVELQANSIETTLEHFPLQSADSPINVALILILALLPVLLGFRLSAPLVGLAAIGLAASYLIAFEWAFRSGLILRISEPLLSLAIATGCVIALDSLWEHRKRVSLEALLDGFLRPGRAAFFISYRRDQGGFVAGSLRSALANRFGESSVFMDVTTIHPGQEWPKEIQEAILGCSAMLVVVGPFWVGSEGTSTGTRRLDDPTDWVRKEVEAGLNRPEVAVIPILVDGARMPVESDLPPSLQPLCQRAAFIVTGLNFDDEVARLVDAIRRGTLRPFQETGSTAPPVYI